MTRRFAKKIDANQNEIVDALRKIPGVQVDLDHNDFFVGYKQFNYWFELKQESAVSKVTGEIKPSAKKIRQIRLENKWTGHYKIVWNIDQILKEMGIA